MAAWCIQDVFRVADGQTRVVRWEALKGWLPLCYNRMCLRHGVFSDTSHLMVGEGYLTK